MWRLLKSCYDFAVASLLYILMGYTVHEIAHLVVLSWLGGEGHIKLFSWGFGTVITVSPPAGLTLVYLAGGLSVVVTYALLYSVEWQAHDLEEQCGLTVAGFMHGAYGIMETLIPMLGLGWFTFLQWSQLALTVGLACGLTIAVIRFAGYWLR